MGFRDFWASILIFAGVFLLTFYVIFPWANFALAREVRIVEPVTDEFLFQPQPSSPPRIASFPFANLLQTHSLEEFYLTIETLGIKKAKVLPNLKIDKERTYLEKLKTALGHLEGSAYPGEWGNVFLLGHSVLPSFFDPKDYTTIFSTLPKLHEEDLVKVEFKGREFVYRVEEKRAIEPSVNLNSVLVGPGKKLTLMTCYPPGLSLKRFLVIARLLEAE